MQEGVCHLLHLLQAAQPGGGQAAARKNTVNELILYQDVHRSRDVDADDIHELKKPLMI